MPRTNSWLCTYAIAQLGKPYLMGSYGKFQTSTQTELMQKDYVDSQPSWYANPNYDKSVKHHDCSGLVLGALMCDTVDGDPYGDTPIVHGSNSQYEYNCNKKSSTMSNFPKIPGTLVFHTNDEGTKSHVGIYVGTLIDPNGTEHSDAVVEAKGRDWGIVISSVSAYKWDCWGQLSVCEIDTKEGMVFDARSSGVGNISIDPTLMTPFVATLSQSFSRDIDYDQIRAARVSAMMFYGGELFDVNHIKRTYVNPHLSHLVKQCNDAGMIYALYVNVRARNEIEADAECRALYYVLAEYPPTLGIWLSLEIDNHIVINDKILEVYYRYIEKWGLKARCGLYVTPNQLSKITWTSFQDRYYLWLIDNMDVTKVDDELLQPEMFEVPD